MWIIIVIFAVGIMAALQLPSLNKKKLRKERSVYLLLLFIAFVLASLESLRIKIPNPLDAVTIAVKPITMVINYIFQ
ncbi:accessory gene regulator protein AgrB [Paenibacillus endophyticus]|uniref:Accessory gene regulator protein AgrB n=1 Tax=Paenibacillus endophyticus TaxID=1294268 RepID=A0A7W5G9Y2_9BACL|nr:hypothetical protein [Paenibacillus endophyticus]MBB3151733.1 accessory gene regulator protein AgrB [Paenibacillus endophyticus]